MANVIKEGLKEHADVQDSCEPHRDPPASIALIPVFAAAQGGLTKEKQGQGGSIVKGAAGTEGSKGDTGLEHCDKPMGAMAVVEPQSEYMMALSR